MGIGGKLLGFIRTIILFGKEEKIKVIPVVIPMDKEKLLQGKIAMITGGSGGIGIEIAKAFLQSGAKVILVGAKEEKLRKACKLLGESDTLRSIPIDITDNGNITVKVKQALELFEEKRIDILVNSAGVNGTNDFFNTNEQEYDRIMDTNVKGTYFISRVVAQTMIDNNIKGHILMVSSSSALRPAWAPYQMSKWAIRGFTMGLADTLLPYGIIVNSIAPGQTATPMVGKETINN